MSETGLAMPTTPEQSRELSGLANALFEHFLAPLVIGGAMRPQAPIGGKRALGFGEGRTTVDIDLFSRVQLARSRKARELAGVDRADPISGDEWALAATLHDLVQLTHPDLAGVFRRSAPTRLMEIVRLTLQRIPGPSTLRDAIARHTLFSRIFEIVRTDTKVSWWTGSATFLGTDPSPRLLAWPQIRQVRVERDPKPWIDLPVHAPDSEKLELLGHFLSKTPLTDFATCERVRPKFAFSAGTLALLGCRGGLTLVTRVLAKLDTSRVNVALGRAVSGLLRSHQFGAVALVASLLSERALAEASQAIKPGRDSKPLSLVNDDDEGLTQALGALAARQFIGLHGECFSATERRALLVLLEPRAKSDRAKALEGALTAG